MNENEILLTNIQRFSLHDGPGIRTTVFLKGCAVRCPWCSNPENIAQCPEEYDHNGERGIYGKYISADELYKELIKDIKFYGVAKDNILNETNISENLMGGVTFSGGEALMQSEKLLPLLERLKLSHIHTCIETGLFVSESKLLRVINYIDLFYVDVKILDQCLCKKILKGDLSQYFSNLKILFNRKTSVIFRIPVIRGYTDSSSNREKIINLIDEFRPLKVEIIKGHNLGDYKYESLGQKPPNSIVPSDKFIDQYKDDIQRETGISAEICRI